MNSIFCKLFLVVIFLISANADDQTPCQGCIDLVDGLLKVSWCFKTLFTYYHYFVDTKDY